MTNEEGFVEFRCPNCHTEIEATPDLIGETTECPACGNRIVVEDNRNDGVARHSEEAPSAAQSQAMKSRTIRIELGDL